VNEVINVTAALKFRNSSTLTTELEYNGKVSVSCSDYRYKSTQIHRNPDDEQAYSIFDHWSPYHTGDIGSCRTNDGEYPTYQCDDSHPGIIKAIQCRSSINDKFRFSLRMLDPIVINDISGLSPS
jgi:hypothetical protein